METLAYETALRRLVDDAVSNFSEFRGALREPGPVIVHFDGTFAIEDSLGAFVHLLDYDYPRARITEYSGENEADAMTAFERCVARVARFCESPGERSVERVDDLSNDLDDPGSRDRWFNHDFSASANVNAPIIVFGCASIRRSEPEYFSIWTEVVGSQLECVDGSPPDQSILALLMGHRYRKRAGGPKRKNRPTYRRQRHD
jgi:hypothetical protein